MAVIRPEWPHEPEQHAMSGRTAHSETFSRAPASEHSSSGNLDALIQRVAGASMDEIDGVIRELESMRELLRREAERVSFDLAAFVNVTQSSMSAMRVISDSLKNLRPGSNNERQSRE
jgi:hypothetical protein